ncbi:hypothetical protein AOLI_G00257350 [Acnodon oligacanthus]
MQFPSRPSGERQASNQECNVQVKFLQKHTKEQEEVFQDVTEESLSPAEVDDEHAVQQVLTWSGLISPLRKEEIS